MLKPLIIVIGSSDFDLSLIRSIPDAKDWKVVHVLGKGDVQPLSGRIDFNDLHARATALINEAGGKPDAIIGDLDFPVTSLVALLRRDFGLPGASVEAVAKCEHKYWMRCEQKKLFPTSTPEFRAVNPFAPDEAKRNALDYPFWLKPVKGHSSVLGFMIEDESEFEEALHVCRQKIHLIGEPFNRFLDYVERASEINGIDGNYAIAEALISAPRQFTMEGYVWNGETIIYGVVDSVREGQHKSSFSRYQYPGDIPDDVVKKACDVTAKFLSQVGYDGSPFNIEFFWDPDSAEVRLLEINPRISKSHSPLFRMVDGLTHHRVAIDLSLGRKPEMPEREGAHNMAAKFMFRSHEADGLVMGVPGREEIENLAKILPDIEAKILVEKNAKLSDPFYQDSYSYELADIFLGGDDEQMLEDAYLRCVDSLPFLIKPIPSAA